MLVENRRDPLLQAFDGMDSVEKRKLNTAVRSPGITLVAPVPELRLEIWKLVGGKGVAVVPVLGGQFSQGWRGQVNPGSLPGAGRPRGLVRRARSGWRRGHDGRS